MSVISVRAIGSRSSRINQEFAREHVLKYRVVTSDPVNDGGITARTAVPWGIGDTYSFGTEYDTGSFCVDVVADEEDVGDGRQWLVTVQFNRAPQLEENPLLQPWDISLDGQAIQLPFDVDSDGRPVCNTVGDPFSTATMKQANQPILSITRNEAAFNPSYHLFANTINADVFFSGAPETVFCQPIHQHREISSTYGAYWPTTYTFVFDPNGWDIRLINQGFRARGPRGVMKNILVQGIPITEPALLTASGDILPQGAPPVILTFKPYPKMPFGALGLV